MKGVGNWRLRRFVNFSIPLLSPKHECRQVELSFSSSSSGIVVHLDDVVEGGAHYGEIVVTGFDFLPDHEITPAKFSSKKQRYAIK